jgi:hypothetical protein
MDRQLYSTNSSSKMSVIKKSTISTLSDKKENEMLKAASCVVDPDPHSFGCPGSGSVLIMRIWILEHRK